MAVIHPTALVDSGAELDDDVTVGAYSVIGPNVRIGSGTTVASHCVIDGHTTIGRDNHFFQFGSIGAVSQDKKYRGEPTRLEIGDGNTIREFCSLHIGTVQDEGVTRVGNHNWIMAYAHIAHDCRVGSHIIMANNAQLAGHVHVGDGVILGGMTGVHQFVKIGAYSMTAASSTLFQDLPPFVMATGSPAAPAGINSEGLKRRGYSPAVISAIRNAYKALYRRGLTLEEAKAALRELHAQGGDAAESLALMLTFLDGTTRGIVRP